MNQLDMAQYIINEFTTLHKRVVAIQRLPEPTSIRILFDDGTSQVVIGKLASDVLLAPISEKSDK